MQPWISLLPLVYSIKLVVFKLHSKMEQLRGNISTSLRFQCFLFQSKLSLSFWGDYVLVATYLINRLPKKATQNRILIELLYCKPRSYDHLKVFRCLYYMSTHKHGKDKFQARAISCVFFTYPNGKKAYKVMDLETMKVYNSRDVIFHEHVFPFP